MNKLLTYKILVTAVLIIAIFAVNVHAIDKNNCSEVEIKTSAYSWECKNIIESNVNSLLGVIESNLDLSSKILTVKIDNSKVTCESIVNTIKKLGYDAEVLCKDAKGSKSVKENKDIKKDGTGNNILD